MAANIELQLHFLLVPLMAQSHIIPLTDFAKLLARQGVFVSIVTTPLNAIRYKAVIDHARAHNLKIQTIPIKFPCQEAGLPDGCENFDMLSSTELSREFHRACELLQSPLENLIQGLDRKPNCIISTTSISWTQKIADRFKIPRYAFETISCFTLFCSPKFEESGVSDSDAFLIPDIPHDIEFTKAQLPNRKKKDSDIENGSQDVLDLEKQARKSVRGTLVNSFQDLEPWYLEALEKERGKVWCIGPVSLCNKEISERCGRGNKASIDEHYCLTWLNSMKPKTVIYACFGSVSRISAAQIKEIGLGLEASNFPFIWIIRKHDYTKEVENWLEEERFEERVRGRGMVVRGWAPQVLILSHQSVGGFLTHCGWNSTLEGICAGVPMITWPMFAEQFFNEKYIVNVLGIGVRVGVDCSMDYCEKYGDYLVKWDRVKNAVEKLMDESEEGIERRKKAQELAKMASDAVEEGGSSYLNVMMLIKDVMKHVVV